MTTLKTRKVILGVVFFFFFLMWSGQCWCIPWRFLGTSFWRCLPLSVLHSYEVHSVAHRKCWEEGSVEDLLPDGCLQHRLLKGQQAERKMFPILKALPRASKRSVICCYLALSCYLNCQEKALITSYNFLLLKVL